MGEMLCYGWVSNGRVTYDIEGFRVRIGYEVEVEAMDMGNGLCPRHR